MALLFHQICLALSITPACLTSTRCIPVRSISFHTLATMDSISFYVSPLPVCVCVEVFCYLGCQSKMGRAAPVFYLYRQYPSEST